MGKTQTKEQIVAEINQLIDLFHSLWNKLCWYFYSVIWINFWSTLCHFDVIFFTTLQLVLRYSFSFTRDMFLLLFSFFENYGTISFFINYFLLLIVAIPFYLSTTSIYTCLYWYVQYCLFNKKTKHNYNCPTNGVYGAWLRCYHCIPCCQQATFNPTTQ